MAISFVPVDPTSYYWTQTTTLDGTPYLLTFRYMTAESCYYLDIQSADGSTNYAMGVKIVCLYGLLRPYQTPPGELFALPTSSDDSTPAAGELGENARVQLIYADAADVYATGTEPERNPGPFVDGIFVPGA